MSRSAIFRVDAGPQIGFGHLSRCLSLAGTLAEADVRSAFVCRDPSEIVRARIEDAGHLVVELPASIVPGSPEDAAETLDVVRGESEPPLLVVDHYRIDSDWEAAVRPSVERLVVIDDLADRPHNCELLIDQNRMFDGEVAYDGLLPGDAQRLIGPRYALLRPEFAARRQMQRAARSEPSSVLVAFGGSDPAGHTLAVMYALGPHLPMLRRVDVLVGCLNPHRAEIEHLASRSNTFRVHVDAPNVAELLATTDLAIGAGGVMSWERACLAVPSLVFGIVPNQVQNVRELVRAGAAVGVAEMFEPDESTISAWVDLVLHSPELLMGMSERAAAMVDGNGARRVAGRLAPVPLHFRTAESDDSGTVYAWRNHPDVRAVSADTGEIDPHRHAKWFSDSLRNPNRLLLVATLHELPLGIVRFDVVGTVATISVYKDPEHDRPVNLVEQATAWLFDNRPDIDHIEAQVMSGNERSAQAFSRAGYRLDEMHFVASRASRVGGKHI